MRALLGHVYAVSGRRDKALKVLRELKERSKREYVSAFYFVLIYLGLHEKDQMFEWLEKAYQERSTYLIWLKVDPIFDGLRSDPRFKELVRRMGLAPSEDDSTPGRAVTPELAGTNSRSIPTEQEIRFCTTPDGVRIAYATVGEGPPLVKAANWLNHLEYDWQSPIWRHLLEEFARDHRLVRYDERGNGLSDWDVENFTFEAFVQDLKSVASPGIDPGPVAVAIRGPARGRA